MIDINLVPGIKRGKKKNTAFKGLNIPKEKVVGMGIALLVFLTFIHILLTVPMIMQFTKNGHVQGKLKEISGEWGKVKVVKKELHTLRNKVSAVDKITTGNRISWSRKLNDLSDSMVKGLWLNKLSLDRNFILIDGSAVSKDKDEMTSPYKFQESLKNKPSFMEGLVDVEVSSVQRRQIKSTQIADFLIKAKLDKNE